MPTIIAIAVLSIMALFADLLRNGSRAIPAPTSWPIRLATYAVTLTLLYAAARIGMAWLRRQSPYGSDSIWPWVADPGSGTKHSRRRTAVTFGLVSLCWLPYATLLYPGVIWYDTEQQLLQWGGVPNIYSDGQLNDHHPIFDTMLYGIFMDAGRILGSADAGIFIFSLVQMACTAFVIALFLTRLHTFGISVRAQRIIGAFLCLFPPLPIWACAVVKDSTNLPFLLLFLLLLWTGPAKAEAVKNDSVNFGTRTRNIRKITWAASLVACACFIALTKKTGVVFVVAVTVMYAACLIHRRIKKPQMDPQWPNSRITMLALFAATVASTVLIAAIMPLVVLPLANAVPGGRQEILGQAFQQAALTLKEHGDDMDVADRNAFTDMLGNDAANRYAWWTVDSVKGDAWSEQQERALPAFLRAWIREGIRHPITYMKSYLAVEQGWFAFPHGSDTNPNAYLTPAPVHMVTRHFEGAGRLVLTFNDGRIAGAMEDAFTWFQESPIGMLVSSKALWTMWALVFLVAEARRRQAPPITIIPLIALNLVLWLSPVTTTDETMRYMMPALFLVPLTIGILTAFTPRHSNNTLCSRRLVVLTDS